MEPTKTLYRIDYLYQGYDTSCYILAEDISTAIKVFDKKVCFPIQSIHIVTSRVFTSDGGEYNENIN